MHSEWPEEIPSNFELREDMPTLILPKSSHEWLSFHLYLTIKHYYTFLTNLESIVLIKDIRREKEMLTCIPCVSTRGLIKDITHHLKFLSLKSKAQRRKKARRPEAPATSTAMANVVAEKEVEVVAVDEEKEWVAEIEHGVLITLVSLPDGRNHIKKIRFSEELFDTWEAQKWWTENCDKIRELFSIHQIFTSQAQPESDEEDTIDSAQPHEPVEPPNSPRGESSGSYYEPEDLSSSDDSQKTPRPGLSLKAQTKKDTGMDYAAGGKGKIVEWMVEHEPGVFLTLRSKSDGSKELTRVELCRERFGDVKAKVWWQENKAMIHDRYLSD